jgi:hypothetical protein
MSSCGKFSPKSQVIEVFDMLDKNFQGAIIPEYLIIIDEIDKTSCCYCKPVYDIIKKNSSKLICGNLDIITFEEYKNPETNIKYKISSDIIKYTLYRKLPADNMYVPEKDFTIHNFTSMYSEFIDILGILNVKSIKVNIKTENENSNNLSLYGNLKNEIKNYLELNKNTNSINKKYNTETMIKYLKQRSNTLYYYHKNEEWQKIIQRRLYGNLNETYHSAIDQTHSIDVNMLMNLQPIVFFKLGANIDNSNKIICEYEIEYYPLEKNEKQKSNSWFSSR